MVLLMCIIAYIISMQREAEEGVCPVNVLNSLFFGCLVGLPPGPPPGCIQPPSVNGQGGLNSYRHGFDL